MKCVCKISVERQYHVAGGGIDSMRGANLHTLLRSTRLLRAASSSELSLRKNMGISVSLHIVLAFAREFRKMPLS
jgi:hypothetical protein